MTDWAEETVSLVGSERRSKQRKHAHDAYIIREDRGNTFFILRKVF